MPITDTARPYPLIDADPHFGRVVRYMRPSDYGLWAGAAAAGPAVLYLYGMSRLSLSNIPRLGGCVYARYLVGGQPGTGFSVGDLR